MSRKRKIIFFGIIIMTVGLFVLGKIIEYAFCSQLMENDLQKIIRINYIFIEFKDEILSGDFFFMFWRFLLVLITSMALYKCLSYNASLYQKKSLVFVFASILIVFSHANYINVVGNNLARGKDVFLFDLLKYDYLKNYLSPVTILITADIVFFVWVIIGKITTLTKQQKGMKSLKED